MKINIKIGFSVFLSFLIFHYFIIKPAFSSESWINQEAVGTADIYINKSDMGISSLMNQWFKTPKSNALKKIAKSYTIEQAGVTIQPSPKTGELAFSVILRTKTSLESKPDREKIYQILSAETFTGKYSKSPYNGLTLYSSQRVDKKCDTGYFIKGNLLVFGKDIHWVKKIADVITSNKNSISSISEYNNLRNRLTGSNDFVCFLNNTQSRFSDILIQQEKKWKMSLLLSAKEINGIIIGINFIDGDKISGTIIFHGKNSSVLIDIQDDAIFLGEAIRRKFSDFNIKYHRSVTARENYVTLSFDMSGLKPLFEGLFEEGVSSLLK